jgi:hypothetical protein
MRLAVLLGLADKMRRFGQRCGVDVDDAADPEAAGRDDTQPMECKARVKRHTRYRRDDDCIMVVMVRALMCATADQTIFIGT